jgi:IS5 family transposase
MRRVNFKILVHRFGELKMNKTSIMKTNLFEIPNMIDKMQDHELAVLSKEIDWDYIESHMLPFYTRGMGRNGISIKLMSGLQILKYIYNLSDQETINAWKNTPIFQAFTGKSSYTLSEPCDVSLLSKFRSRIGVEGANILFIASKKIHGQYASEPESIIDSTVQVKWTAYPTDIKLAIDVINSVINVSDHLEIKLRNKYIKEVSTLKKDASFTKSNKRAQIRTDCKLRLREIASTLLEELNRKVPLYVKLDPNFISMYDNYKKAITQEQNDKDKIYSIFEPQVKCIAKGKFDKKYEFGCKVGLMLGKDQLVLQDIVTFSENIHDSKTLPIMLDRSKELYDFKPDTVTVDRGYKGHKEYKGTKVILPVKGLSDLPKQEKNNLIQYLNRRSAVEQAISHEKTDYRLGVNYLRDTIGDHINPLLSGTAYNCALFMRRYSKQEYTFDYLKKLSYKSINKCKPVKVYKKSKYIPFCRPNHNSIDLLKSLRF